MKLADNPGSPMGPQLPADPRDWPDGVKLAHAMRMAERTIDQYPGIAEGWLRACDSIRSRMMASGCQ